MNKIVMHGLSTIVPYEAAPAGSICEIIDANGDTDKEGSLCIKPYCTNQAVVILNINYASTDLSMGIRTVRPLQKGESFTVTIG